MLLAPCLPVMFGTVLPHSCTFPSSGRSPGLLWKRGQNNVSHAIVRFAFTVSATAIV